jgi:hypothetical protein
MDYAVLWLSGLTGGLLFVALVTALSSRRKTTLRRRIWPVLAFLVGLFYLSPMVVAGVMLVRENIQPKWLLWYGASQALTYLAGALAIMVRGLKGVATDQQAARLWGRGRLAILLGVVAAIYLATAAISDLDRRLVLVNVRTETLARISGLLPLYTPEPLNAYPWYERAMAAAEYLDDPPAWLRDNLASGAGFDQEQARQLLEAYDQALDLVREASAKPILAWDVDLADPLSSPLPKLQYFTMFAQLLNLSARYRMLQNDSQGAMADLKTIEAMSEQLRGFPSLLTVMVGGVLDKHYYQGLEYVLAQGACGSENLCQVPVACRPSPLDSFLKALRVEALIQLLALSKYSGGNVLALADDSAGVWAAAPASIYWRIFFLPSELDSARFITYEGLAKPAANYQEAVANLEGIGKARQEGRFGLLTSIVMPGYDTYLNRVKDYDARRGLSDLALAVTAYQAAHHAYPAHLADLIPEFIDRLPVDPYGIGTFDLTVVEGGVVLSSAKPSQATEGEQPGRPLDFVLGGQAYRHRFPDGKQPPD